MVIIMTAGSSGPTSGHTLINSKAGEAVNALVNDRSMFQDAWTPRDTTTPITIAKINSRGSGLAVAQQTLSFGRMIPSIKSKSFRLREAMSVTLLDGCR